MQFFWTYVTTISLILLGLFLIFIVLLQRGRGGGLAGAFGGLGGQSAFGTKAGDVFTKITVVVAVLWVGMASVAIFVMRSEAQGRFQGGSQVGPENPQLGPAEPGDQDRDIPIAPPEKDDEAGPGSESGSSNQVDQTDADASDGVPVNESQQSDSGD